MKISPEKLAKELRRYPSLMKRKTRTSVGKVMTDLRTELAIKAPVDEGVYQGNWIYRNQHSTGSNVLGHGIVSNRTPYGRDIELGSAPGKDPWPRVGPKTVKRQGRIWSSQAPLGTVNKTLTPAYINRMFRGFVNQLFSVLR